MAAAADFATLPRNLALAAVFNAVIAAGIAIAQRHPFSEALVYSYCIGYSCLFLIDVPRRLAWGRRIPPQAGIVALSTAGIAGGFVIGTTLASLALGHPVKHNLTGDGLVTSGAITFFAGIAACWYFMNRERLAQLRLAAEKVERSEVEARLKLLQAQIEPHFLFNTLANLHSLIASDPPRAQRMLEHLNDYLRATLSATRNDTATLGEEFALLRGFLEIIAIRMGPRLAFTLSLPDELAAARIPPMLLQPLVENAVRHGLESKIDGGSIAVSASSQSPLLVIRVADDGLGLGTSAGGTNVGLEHVRQRLSAAYGSDASLRLEANPAGGAIATVSIPMKGAA